MIGPIVLIVAIIAGAVVVGIGMHRPDDSYEPPDLPPPFLVPELDVKPGSAVPKAVAIAPRAAKRAKGAKGPTTAAVRDWAGTLAEKIQVPARSLVAYAEAELAIRANHPACKISWATLAGVGRVESHHGEYNGSDVGADGRLSPPMIGVPLDGSPGVQAVPDTDRGKFDGDPKWDRAVGAMQF